jgi:hypothetical protein
MMKKFYLCFVALIFSAFQSDNKIPWKETTKLTWDDFKGKPDASSAYKANTETEVAIQIKTKGEAATIIIECFFIKNASWTKDINNAFLLGHEQTHFNISEIGARKFRQKLKGKTFSAKTFQRELNNMRSETGKESKAMQAEYDKETEHSVNEAAQKKWNKKVTDELKSLAAYAEPQISCKITR